MRSLLPLVLVIHNVRSAHNVGALLRTADGAGVAEVWLSGYTPAPARPGQSMLSKAEKSLAKAALGAEHTVAWKRHSAIGSLLSRLKRDGYQIVGLEQSPRSVSFSKLAMDIPRVLLVGNEVRGLDKRLMDQCDVLVEIPMYGKKNSLNVSVAGGIGLYALRGLAEGDAPK